MAYSFTVGQIVVSNRNESLTGVVVEDMGDGMYSVAWDGSLRAFDSAEWLKPAVCPQCVDCGNDDDPLTEDNTCYDYWYPTNRRERMCYHEREEDSAPCLHGPVRALVPSDCTGCVECRMPEGNTHAQGCSRINCNRSDGILVGRDDVCPDEYASCVCGANVHDNDDSCWQCGAVRDRS